MSVIKDKMISVSTADLEALISSSLEKVKTNLDYIRRFKVVIKEFEEQRKKVTTSFPDRTGRMPLKSGGRIRIWSDLEPELVPEPEIELVPEPDSPEQIPFDVFLGLATFADTKIIYRILGYNRQIVNKFTNNDFWWKKKFIIDVGEKEFDSLGYPEALEEKLKKKSWYMKYRMFFDSLGKIYYQGKSRLPITELEKEIFEDEILGFLRDELGVFGYGRGELFLLKNRSFFIQNLRYYVKHNKSLNDAYLRLAIQQCDLKNPTDVLYFSRTIYHILRDGVNKVYRWEDVVKTYVEKLVTFKRSPSGPSLSTYRARSALNLIETVVLYIHKTPKYTDALKDKNLMINLIYIHPDIYLKDYNRFKDDRGVVLVAVSGNGAILIEVSSKFQDDKLVVTDAVRNYPGAIAYASERLKNDPAFIIDLYKKTDVSYQALPTDIRNNEDVVIAMIKRDAGRFQFVSYELKGNKRVALEAVKLDGLNLSYVSTMLKYDKTIVEEAIKNDPRSIKFASPKLQTYFRDNPPM
jgi:hypothetical protein